ncbi:MAG: RNA 3'-terminal phosphate cyclase [Candidatus Glassbacteria bacterium]
MGWVSIDGSYGEGGGQILRSSLTMSAITGKPVRISNIRAGRKVPGLAPQHLAAVRVISSLFGAEVQGDQLGSTEVSFRPGKPSAGSYVFDVGTAGSVTLVLQTILPATLLLGLRRQWVITGGTDVPWSPSSTYFQEIYCHTLSRLGYGVEANVVSHGFYPKGGGTIELKTTGSNLSQRIDFSEKGEVTSIELHSVASESLRGAKVAERQIEGFKTYIEDVDIRRIEYVKSRSTGTFIFARAVYRNTVLGATCLGKKGLPAEEVGKSCAHELLAEMDGEGTVDIYMSDQILPYLVYQGGTVKVRQITDHLTTNAYVLGEFGYDLTIEPPSVKFG